MSKDPNQGEGDRASARRYDKHLRDFISGGKVEPAATEARGFVDTKPDEAAAAERAAKRGPNGHIYDDLVAKARSWLARLRETAHRARARFAQR